jgi:hypothetical protein
MQEQIADAIHLFGRPPPDLVVRQLAEAMLDAAERLVEFVGELAGDEFGEGRVQSRDPRLHKADLAIHIMLQG